MNDSAPGSNPDTGKPPTDKALRRAALVLVSLDDRQAAQLMARMSPRQVEAVTAVIENLEEIDTAEQQQALREFYGRMGIDPPDIPAMSPGPQVMNAGELSDDVRNWPAEAIRFSFEPGLAEDWALALADAERAQIRRVLKALTHRDRKLLAEADRRRGPWRLHEPHEARERIRAKFAGLRISGRM